MDRVLEIGGFAAGYCGRLFVQGGAEVVRIESAQHSSGLGEFNCARSIPPPWQTTGDDR